jgi:hypothetical protein
MLFQPDKKYLSLPVRQKKNGYNKRSGAHASMMRKHYKVDLPVDDDFEPKKKKRSYNQRKAAYYHKRQRLYRIIQTNNVNWM